MATVSDKLQKLHPDIIKDYLDTGVSEGIPEEVRKYIDMLDKVPDIHRRCASPTKTAKELQSKFPDIFRSFNTARAIVYAAINHFHLNISVKNEAWDHFYADHLDELARIEAKKGNAEGAKRILLDAHALRTNKDDSGIDADLLKPIVQVISPVVTPQLLDLDDEEYDLKTIDVEWRKKKIFDDTKKFVKDLKGVSENQASIIIKEAALNLNITDVEPMNEEDGD
ncbi:MAG: hypothetical protein N4A59_06210 [Marinifilum sp.]|jgi:hypothetical protein|nr:hypothetical protein [Marinifilum sp.]